MGTKGTWRDFEKLVARIERVAAPRGAIVKSPDRITDLSTGKRREVDASIRYQVGTASVLITIECRRRGRKADDTWIEQLATKRQKLGAAKTIAVSEAGFTGSAVTTAKQFGIELRTLTEVSSADITGWFLPGGAVHVFRVIEDVRCFVILYDPTGEPSPYGFFLPVEEPFYSLDPSGPAFSVKKYIPAIEDRHPELFVGIPLDGTKVEVEMAITWNRGELSLLTSSTREPVYLTKLIVNVSYQSAVCELDSGVHHKYADENGTLVQRTVFDTQLLGEAVRFEHQSGPAGSQMVSYQFGLPPNDEPDAETG